MVTLYCLLILRFIKNLHGAIYQVNIRLCRLIERHLEIYLNNEPHPATVQEQVDASSGEERFNRLSEPDSNLLRSAPINRETPVSSGKLLICKLRENTKSVTVTYSQSDSEDCSSEDEEDNNCSTVNDNFAFVDFSKLPDDKIEAKWNLTIDKATAFKFSKTKKNKTKFDAEDRSNFEFETLENLHHDVHEHSAFEKEVTDPEKVSVSYTEKEFSKKLPVDFPAARKKGPGHKVRRHSMFESSIKTPCDAEDMVLDFSAHALCKKIALEASVCGDGEIALDSSTHERHKHVPSENPVHENRLVEFPSTEVCESTVLDSPSQEVSNSTGQECPTDEACEVAPVESSTYEIKSSALENTYQVHSDTGLEPSAGNIHEDIKHESSSHPSHSLSGMKIERSEHQVREDKALDSPSHKLPEDMELQFLSCQAPEDMNLESPTRKNYEDVVIESATHKICEDMELKFPTNKVRKDMVLERQISDNSGDTFLKSSSNEERDDDFESPVVKVCNDSLKYPPLEICKEFEHSKRVLPESSTDKDTVLETREVEVREDILLATSAQDDKNENSGSQINEVCEGASFEPTIHEAPEDMVRESPAKVSHEDIDKHAKNSQDEIDVLHKNITPVETHSNTFSKGTSENSTISEICSKVKITDNEMEKKSVDTTLKDIELMADVLIDASKDLLKRVNESISSDNVPNEAKRTYVLGSKFLTAALDECQVLKLLSDDKDASFTKSDLENLNLLIDELKSIQISYFDQADESSQQESSASNRSAKFGTASDAQFKMLRYNFDVAEQFSKKSDQHESNIPDSKALPQNSEVELAKEENNARVVPLVESTDCKQNTKFKTYKKNGAKNKNRVSSDSHSVPSTSTKIVENKSNLACNYLNKETQTTPMNDNSAFYQKTRNSPLIKCDRSSFYEHISRVFAPSYLLQGPHEGITFVTSRSNDFQKSNSNRLPPSTPPPAYNESQRHFANISDKSKMKNLNTNGNTNTAIKNAILSALNMNKGPGKALAEAIDINVGDGTETVIINTGDIAETATGKSIDDTEIAAIQTKDDAKMIAVTTGNLDAVNEALDSHRNQISQESAEGGAKSSKVEQANREEVETPGKKSKKPKGKSNKRFYRK